MVSSKLKIKLKLFHISTITSPRRDRSTASQRQNNATLTGRHMRTFSASDRLDGNSNFTDEILSVVVYTINHVLSPEAAHRLIYAAILIRII